MNPQLVAFLHYSALISSSFSHCFAFWFADLTRYSTFSRFQIDFFWNTIRLKFCLSALCHHSTVFYTHSKPRKSRGNIYSRTYQTVNAFTPRNMDEMSLWCSSSLSRWFHSDRKSGRWAAVTSRRFAAFGEVFTFSRKRMSFHGNFTLIQEEILIVLIFFVCGITCGRVALFYRFRTVFWIRPVWVAVKFTANAVKSGLIKGNSLISHCCKWNTCVLITLAPDPCPITAPDQRKHQK